jgi:hypothetical protein
VQEEGFPRAILTYNQPYCCSAILDPLDVSKKCSDLICAAYLDVLMASPRDDAGGERLQDRVPITGPDSDLSHHASIS